MTSPSPEDGGTGRIGRPVYSSCFPRLDLGSLGLGLSMSAVRRGSVFLCGFVSGERRHGCGEDGVPSSLIDGGFPVSSADDSTRSGNKTAFFPAGGVVGGVKLLSLLLSVGLVLRSCARCSADSGGRS